MQKQTKCAALANRPTIKALGKDGIIAIGERVSDEVLASHDLAAGNGEEAVYIPAEIIEAYVVEILKQISEAPIVCAHETAHIVQAGGTNGEKTQA